MRSVAVLEIGATRARLGFEAPDGVEWTEEREYADPAKLVDVVDLLLSRPAVRRAGRLRIHLHPPHVQLRSLRGLPDLASSELSVFVQEQRNRFFRLNGDAAVIDACWMADAHRENGDGRRARGAAASVPLVTCLEDAAVRARLELVGIGPPLDDPAHGLHLESPEAAVRRARRSRKTTGMFLLAGALVWVAAIGLYVTDLVRDRAAVTRELAALEEPLGRVLELRSRVEDFAPVATVLSAQGPEGAWAGGALAAISQALPDSSYLIELTLERGGPIRLAGIAQDPLDVVESVEQSGLPRPSMEGTPTSEARDGRSWYRFALNLPAIR